MSLVLYSETSIWPCLA